MQDLWSEVVERVSGGSNASNLAFLILTATLLLAPLLAKRARLPSLVALVLLGMAIGPHGFGLLATQEIALTALGEFGLLYLMFTAGLELDLRQLARNKRLALAFAALSFAIPFSLGLMSARALGYAWAAAVLMGSNWGSHTLVTYPMVRKQGLARSRPVSIVVGATVLTDTAALLVLAAVSVTAQRTGSFVAEGTEVVLGLTILVLWSLKALPKLARYIFARLGTDEAQRLVFAIVALFIGAILAEASGIDGIVGAFFAGLGLGRAIPEQSPLMDRAQFLGASLLIPIFLVSVGVLLQPSVMFQPKTLLYALVFATVVLGGKAAAASLVGRRAGFSWPEIGVMSGLSGSQAAASLATTLVGARLNLFDALTVNAVLVVILASLVITPALVNTFGPKVARAQAEARRLGQRVVVPVHGESSWPLLPVAERVAETDGGMVVAAAFAGERASDEELAAQRALRDEAERRLAERGLEAQALFRTVSSKVRGMIDSVRAEEGTLIVSEWAPHGRRLDEDSESLEHIGHSPVPHLLVHGGTDSFDRVVVVARAQDLASPGDRRDFDLALDLGKRLAKERVPYVVYGKRPSPSRGPLAVESAPAGTAAVGEPASDPLGWAETNLRESDLLLLPGLDAAREAISRSPQTIGRRFFVAVAARARSNAA